MILAPARRSRSPSTRARRLRSVHRTGAVGSRDRSQLSYPGARCGAARGGHWQMSDTLSHLGLDPEVAVDGTARRSPFGRVPRALKRRSGLRAAPGSHPKLVLTPGGGEPQVATNARVMRSSYPRGRLRITRRAIEVAARSAGGAFSPPQMISGTENAHEPRVAMNARGERSRGVAGRFRGRLSGACGISSRWRRLEQARNGLGCARVLRRRQPSSRDRRTRRRDSRVVRTTGPSVVREAATRPANGRWGARRLLAMARDVARPEVGMDARGDAIVAGGRNSTSGPRPPAGRRWLAAQMVANSRGLRRRSPSTRAGTRSSPGQPTMG